MKYVRKADQNRRGGGNREPSVPKQWRDRFPAVWEYLAATTYDGGEERETSTLTIFAEEGVLKGCLRDRDQDRALWVTGPTPEALLEALERALESGEADWRDSTWNKPSKRQRRG